MKHRPFKFALLFVLGMTSVGNVVACEVFDYQHKIATASDERLKLSLVETTNRDNFKARQKDITAAFGYAFGSYSDFQVEQDKYTHAINFKVDYKKETAYLETYLDDKGVAAYVACLQQGNNLSITAEKEDDDGLLFKISLNSPTKIDSLRLTMSGQDHCSGASINNNGVITVDAQRFETHVSCTLKYNKSFTVLADSQPLGFSTGFEYKIFKFASCARPEHGIAYDDQGHRLVKEEPWSSGDIQGKNDDSSALNIATARLYTKFAEHKDLLILGTAADGDMAEHIKEHKAPTQSYHNDGHGNSTRVWHFNVSYDPTYARVAEPRCGVQDDVIASH